MNGSGPPHGHGAGPYGYTQPTPEQLQQQQALYAAQLQQVQFKAENQDAYGNAGAMQYASPLSAAESRPPALRPRARSCPLAMQGLSAGAVGSGVGQFRASRLHLRVPRRTARRAAPSPVWRSPACSAGHARPGAAGAL